MWVPSSEWMKWAPIAVLGASLLGSGHCVAMCGGIAVTQSDSKSRLIQYHLGRLAGYSALGALAGWLGQAVFQSVWMNRISWVAASFLAASFVWMGIQSWKGEVTHVSILPNPVLQALFRRAKGRALGVGILTALLPCGWLHGFVLSSIATQDAFLGALTLAFFWMGTLPALASAPWMIRKIFKPLALRAPRVTAVLLIAAGVFSLGIRLSPHPEGRAQAPSSPHCHHH